MSMKTANARAIARRSNELGRALKQLRDGVGDAHLLAATCVRLAAELPFGTVGRMVRDLGIAEILGDLRAERTDEVARRSPAYRPERRQLEHATPTPIESSSEHLLPPDTPADRLGSSRERLPRAQQAQEFRTLRSDEVLEIHRALVEDFATTPDPIDPPGVKHPDLLESAMSRQFTSWGGEPKYKTLAHMAAALFYGLALNHPFHNGNKRTALVSLICLADANNLNVTANEDELFDFVLRVVKHEFRPVARMPASAAMDAEVEAMATWIRPRLKRKEHFQRLLRWRDMKAALRRLDVVMEPAAGSQLECTRGRLRTVVDFDGDSREVGPLVVRKLRKDLQLTPRDGCDDDVFYGDALPLDHFIAKYRGLLRDLAHV